MFSNIFKTSKVKATSLKLTERRKRCNGESGQGNKNSGNNQNPEKCRGIDSSYYSDTITSISSEISKGES